MNDVEITKVDELMRVCYEEYRDKQTNEVGSGIGVYPSVQIKVNEDSKSLCVGIFCTILDLLINSVEESKQLEMEQYLIESFVARSKKRHNHSFKTFSTPE